MLNWGAILLIRDRGISERRTRANHPFWLELRPNADVHRATQYDPP